MQKWIIAVAAFDEVIECCDLVSPVRDGDLEFGQRRPTGAPSRKKFILDRVGPVQILENIDRLGKLRKLIVELCDVLLEGKECHLLAGGIPTTGHESTILIIVEFETSQSNLFFIFKVRFSIE
jgi:hypothetical protein